MIHVVHHPAYVTEAPARSTYRWGKNGGIRDLLRAQGEAVAWTEPALIPRAWLEAVHDPDYVAEVLEARVPPEKTRRTGFPITEQVAFRAQAVPGGTWTAAMLALEHGFAANTAGGSHHALANTGAGYCVFNDLAVAAVRLVEQNVVARVAIVDCDVHQGDGTAALTAGRHDIVTYSIHAEKNFPARKARSTLDVGLADGVDDDGYLAELEATLVPFLDEHRPDIILYQAGVDPFVEDRLGRLAVTREGLIARETLIADIALARGVPLASTVGGGYGEDVMAIAQRHVDAILTLGERLSHRNPARIEA
ncbi:histone deacetylase family protein [Sphingomonas sanguinis]|jgi:acetoin utilization deacetylase AcuC-like enzyme|uniref:Histone deacetylase n=1 Tax=Sphingomonas sanguinis TaxID=33051 RepID=A0A7Y7QUH3_9SPHN|nr:histone deacetylase [Sphingomonas sanguinis]MBZ6381379.1 histone deacetylase [Sphingomonas sanguinis]NNG51020.1 histone deacetylase [Sphingomonas sanguinis]NNG53034.1 histone deacetylase [Sphingomonas sanguinis]NVP30681.1 histone deacetylase [Sphingomonas sanguinis]